MVPNCQNVGKTSENSTILKNVKLNKSKMAITKFKRHYFFANTHPTTI